MEILTITQAPDGAVLSVTYTGDNNVYVSNSLADSPVDVQQEVLKIIEDLK